MIRLARKPNATSTEKKQTKRIIEAVEIKTSKANESPARVRTMKWRGNKILSTLILMQRKRGRGGAQI